MSNTLQKAIENKIDNITMFIINYTSASKFIKNHALGLAVAVHFTNNTDIYEKLFRFGIYNNKALDYAVAYTKFYLYCKIMNKDISYITYLAEKNYNINNN